MKTQKVHIENKVENKPQANPLIKMIGDKKRIVKAIREGKDLSKLEGIKFVSPI